MSIIKHKQTFKVLKLTDFWFKNQWGVSKDTKM